MFDNDLQTSPTNVILEELSISSKRSASSDNLNSQSGAQDCAIGIKKPRTMSDIFGTTKLLELCREHFPERSNRLADVDTSIIQSTSCLGMESTNTITRQCSEKSVLQSDERGLVCHPLLKTSCNLKEQVDLTILQGIDFNNITEEDLNLDFESMQVPMNDSVLMTVDQNTTSTDYRQVKPNNKRKSTNSSTSTSSRNTASNFELPVRKGPNNDNIEEGRKGNPFTCDIRKAVASLSVKRSMESSAHNLEKQPVSYVTPSRNQSSKRKFPGPAGALPQLSPHELFGATDSPSTLVHDRGRFSSLTEKVPLTNVEIPSSQSVEDLFRKEPWLAMKNDFSSADANGQNLIILKKFTIAWVLKKATRKRFSTRKVPMLCVLLRSIVNTEADVSAVLQDPTGKIIGSICRKLMEKYASQIQPGCVFVLRQIGVFSPLPKKHYLNITESNVVRIYTEDDQGQMNCLQLSTESSWLAILKEACEMATSTSLLARHNSDSLLLNRARNPSVFSLMQMNPANEPLLAPNTVTRPANSIGSVTSHAANTMADQTVGYESNQRAVVKFTSRSNASIVNETSKCSKDPKTQCKSGFNLQTNNRNAEQMSSKGAPSAAQLQSSSSSTNSRFTFRSVRCSSITSPNEMLKGGSSLLAVNHIVSPVPNHCSLSDDPVWADDEFDSLMQTIDVDNLNQVNS